MTYLVLTIFCHVLSKLIMIDWVFNLTKKLLIVCCLFLLAGCSFFGFSDNQAQNSKKADSGTPASFFETQWQLDRYWFEDGWVSNLETERISIVFLENYHLNGFSGCNAFSASYKLRDNKLLIQSIRSTRKYCQSHGDIVMHTESLFLRLLESVDSYSINQNTLVMRNNRGQTILLFNRK